MLPILPMYGYYTLKGSKDVELIEIGASDFEQSWEEMPIDIWTCSECQRRFFVMGSHEDEDAKPSD